MKSRSSTPNDLSNSFNSARRVETSRTRSVGRIVFTAAGSRVIKKVEEVSSPIAEVLPGRPNFYNIEDFVIMKIVGQGAYATVKAVKHRITGIVYVLKTYEKHRLIDPMRKRAVQREIKVLKLLDHPNIIKFHNCITTSKQVHLLCDYIAGQSLQKVIKEKYAKRFTEPETRDIFR